MGDMALPVTVVPNGMYLMTDVYVKPQKAAAWERVGQLQHI
jgi:hypothetical protein